MEAPGHVPSVPSPKSGTGGRCEIKYYPLGKKMDAGSLYLTRNKN